ncbi:MAG: phosphoribosylformylglycinamidine synthase subunit PurQ, partial [Clostridia bacterium]|nr:phosphoribosylformylglycinamidine synthase subunit PurQ [Clostridia bacterium]
MEQISLTGLVAPPDPNVCFFKIGVARPKVVIPVFPGTNCEYDSARAVERAGLEPQILVVNNQSAQGV